MSEALFGLALLAYPVGMVLMMWFMMRGGQHGGEQVQAPVTQEELARLRAEVEQLHAVQDGPARTGAQGADAPPVSRAAVGGRVTEQLSARRMMWAQTCTT
ncbi:MAG: hypothetical protein ACR2FV_10885 [Ornithinimicrobium sp.]|uniref:hypothetical protein n=1 Tax=Ornithinimicrobium sp. TaxID=1977084 RepID=UPI003D9BA671